VIHAVPALFGALFTAVTAWSLGMLLLRRLNLMLDKWEERLLAFMAGSACLSAIMFVLSALRVVRHGVLWAVALAILAYTAYSGVLRPSKTTLPPLPKYWRGIFGVGFAAFTYIGFFNALAPEHSSDGMAYHLGEVVKYQNAHGFLRITTDIYASLSQGIELLYFFAFNFGRHSAAGVLHFIFLLTLAFLIVCYGKRISRPNVGAAAALFTYACPIVLVTASTAYVDVALAAYAFSLFYVLQVWDENRNPKLLVLVGLFAGFCYAIKYTGFVAVPYAIGFVAWKQWRKRQPLLRPLLMASGVAALCVLPWMVKDWIEVANPLSPFANRIFPNPYVHVSFEDRWRQLVGTYGLNSREEIPLQITVQGVHVEGFLGPLFLFAPLGLLALRYRAGRQVLLGAAIFAAAYFENIGTRFLIPAVPLVSLALALVIADVQWLLPTVAVLNLIVCLPPVYDLYCAPTALRIDQVPVRAALRLEPEDEYLRQDPDYVAARMISGLVPPNQAIFAVNQGGQSYLQRDLRIGYKSAANEVLQDILWTPVVRALQPSRIFKFDFAPRDLRRLRVIQTARLPDHCWSVAELRVFHGPDELPRDPVWRLTAHPNPWDVQLAFDNSPVTRWRSWEPAAPGMYLQLDFGKLENVSAVVVESSDDAGDIKMELEGASDGSENVAGGWTTLSDRPTESRHPIRASLRLAATAELKARGIHYLVVNPGDPSADDLRRYSSNWGLRLAGTSNQTRLYHIQ
jgi:hypothetical protein